MKKEDIINRYNLNKTQVEKIDYFLLKIINHNQHTNLVGKSTLINIWDRHVLDCLQLSDHISKKNIKILDIGTGAGLPGILLSIIGFKKILMIDSVRKKTDFVNIIIKDLSLSAKIQNKRIEKAILSKQDLIISRALAPLIKLLSYTLLHSNKNTTSLFLKGRSVNSEIELAKKNFHFDFKMFKSISGGGGCILQVKKIKKK
ncbi:16S rRNA (guanine(527)-N(7))-methyltransferase RsmG [Alphaproteobacteria bacterium]|nr:16S rRNA (guanine(527)-N(7))-methyltransferase RsmG [Alphaproteobacteria bacterium]